MSYYRCPACRALSTGGKKCEFCGAPKPKKKKSGILQVGCRRWLADVHERILSLGEVGGSSPPPTTIYGRRYL